MTFVKTKLIIEQMAQGQTLEIRLKGQEPVENVPRNIKDHGHQILAFTYEDDNNVSGKVYRLVMRKS